MYYGFYVVGLRHFGRVRYGPSVLDGQRHGLLVTVDGRRIYVDAADGPGINREALAWADVYGKVNLTLQDSSSSLMAIGPSYGVTAWGPVGAAVVGTQTALLGRTRDFREHYAWFYRQWRYRVAESAYVPTVADPQYVFFLSSLWVREAQANEIRARFVRAARSTPGLQCDGGFAPRRDGNDLGYSSITVSDRISITEYLDRLKRSVVAFNTPAVRDCHGWKLAEYLAMGKATITTPLSRELPAPLEHRVHLHIVDGSMESINDALTEIRNDASYRRSLEVEARRYYEQYLAPRAVIGRLVG